MVLFVTYLVVNGCIAIHYGVYHEFIPYVRDLNIQYVNTDPSCIAIGVDGGIVEKGPRVNDHILLSSSKNSQPNMNAGSTGGLYPGQDGTIDPRLTVTQYPGLKSDLISAQSDVLATRQNNVPPITSRSVNLNDVDVKFTRGNVMINGGKYSFRGLEYFYKDHPELFHSHRKGETKINTIINELNNS
ncbi:hypothetical protein IAQ61_008539 [Plenodomus lingam]|uniref:uncharacterized protein n=1 Tax=Leptosphaeria maculans TaxID=5022 RepID=UPI003325DF4E|nr:hypothetical protein IAQ61_008539 [Plenodomus lingam]